MVTDGFVCYYGIISHTWYKTQQIIKKNLFSQL